MIDRYNIHNLKRALNNPSLFIQEVHYVSILLFLLIRKYIYIIHNHYFVSKYGHGEDIIAKDWDNLIILDACRYDYFKDRNTLEGDLKPCLSKGSHSWEFMQGNFVGRDLSDTVYVTSNPHVEKLSDDVFYTVISLLKEWDDEIGTVRPENVVEAAIEAENRYPNKRLIIHFMQPHKPHIGPTANKIRDRVNLRGWDKYHGHSRISSDLDGMNLWTEVKKGLVSHDELRNSYKESLDLVLNHVDGLSENLRGKTIITADHGEMLGEVPIPLTGRRYGHPHDIYTNELRVVPWFTIESENRKEIIKEDPIGFEKLSDEIINKRLRALGYAE